LAAIPRPDNPPTAAPARESQDGASLALEGSEPLSATPPDLPRLRPRTRPESAGARPAITASVADENTPRPATRPGSVIVANLLADLTYSYLDPRVQSE
jgi:hypothetical protein